MKNRTNIPITKVQKLSLNDLLGKMVTHDNSQFLPLSFRTYIKTQKSDDDEGNYRMEKLASRYSAMQQQKIKTYLTNQEKKNKINNFLRRSQYFQEIKQQKLIIKQRLKEIYDQNNCQVLFHPHRISRQIDPQSHDCSAYCQTQEDEDLEIAEQESIMRPYD